MMFRSLRDEHVFAIIYGLFAAYFSGIMVRLMLTLTPIACVLSGIAVSVVLDTYLKNPEPSAVNAAGNAANNSNANVPPPPPVVRPGRYTGIPDVSLRGTVLAPLILVLLIFPLHCTFVTQSAYSSPSIVLASRRADGSSSIIDDFRVRDWRKE